MTAHPLPLAALDDRLGFLGTSGSGKTYNAGTAVERLLARKARVVIIDPLGVWWGLRLATDGKTASPFSVVIFGGPRGDIALTEHAGRLIGETAATMAESCIVDLSELASKAADRRFMLAFLEAIYAKASGEPFHLVVDEADLFAPQKPARPGDEMLLHHMEQIVRRGRVKGFIPWLISQRPAVLNKNVLSQVDGLVAFKLTSTQDRDALDHWIEGQADRAQGRAIKDSLPTLTVGQGIVWLPARGILQTASFPQKATFDSSRTPKRGEKATRTTALTPLDVGRLRQQLASVEEEAKANDPQRLRAEIVALKAEKAKLEKQATAAAGKAAPDATAIAKAHSGGKIEGYADAMAGVQAMVAGIRDKIAPLKAQLAAVEQDIAAIEKWAKRPKPAAPPPPQPLPRAAPTVPPQSPAADNPRPPIAVPRQPPDDGALPGPERRILGSLAAWAAMGQDLPNNAQVAWLAGYSPTSTSYTNPRGALRAKGLIAYPIADRLGLTAEGEVVAEPAALNGSLIDHVLGQLPGPEQRILRAAIAAYPEAGTNEDIAVHAGYSPRSTSYTNPRGALKSKELISYPAPGQVRAADWLFV